MNTGFYRNAEARTKYGHIIRTGACLFFVRASANYDRLHPRDHVGDTADAAHFFHFLAGNIRRILDAGEAEAEFVGIS